MSNDSPDDATPVLAALRRAPVNRRLVAAVFALPILTVACDPPPPPPPRAATELTAASNASACAPARSGICR